eukprot:gene10023-11863_t
MAVEKKLSPLAISLLQPSDKNVNVLKKIHSQIFSSSYQEKFFTDSLECLPFTSMVAAICCRLEKLPSGKSTLYISTLGVLSPYRGRGIGKKLLANVMKLAKEDQKIDEVYFHVPVNNAEATGFLKSCGFAVEGHRETIQGYTDNCDPVDCHVYVQSVSDWVAPEGVEIEEI